MGLACGLCGLRKFDVKANQKFPQGFAWCGGGVRFQGASIILFNGLRSLVCLAFQLQHSDVLQDSLWVQEVQESKR